MIPEDPDGHAGPPTDAQHARDALETVENVAETAGQASEGLDQLARGAGSGNLSDLGSGIGGLADAASRVVPAGEARSVMRGVGEAARAIGRTAQSARGLVDRLGSMLGGGNNVHYHIEVDGVDTPWHVRSLHYEDAIGTLSRITVSAACERDTFVEEAELFGKDAHVIIERGEEQRALRGMICRSFVHHGNEEQVVHMEIVPACGSSDRHATPASSRTLRCPTPSSESSRSTSRPSTARSVSSSRRSTRRMNT